MAASTPSVPMPKRLSAELLGTFVLVFGGCGSAVLSAGFPELGIGFLGVALAFGLTVMTMAYAIGHISGAHLNPAVSIGMWCARRFAGRDVLPYILVQLLGAGVAIGLLYVVATGRPGFELGTFAANGYGEHSPGGYALLAALVAEVLLTFVFVLIILGATDDRAPLGFAPLAIGLGLTLVHLVGIPVTNLSVNPARSTAPALVVGGWALTQLWVFWVAPIAGAVAAGFSYPALFRAIEKAPLREKLAEPSERAVVTEPAHA
jgi:aquaporin Z